jgi:hypothetical protein
MKLEVLPSSKTRQCWLDLEAGRSGKPVSGASGRERRERNAGQNGIEQSSYALSEHSQLPCRQSKTGKAIHS